MYAEALLLIILLLLNMSCCYFSCWKFSFESYLWCRC